jgi:leucyl aminopeptidase (aminopeptidase T)
MPDGSELRSTPAPAALRRGARNAVRSCLGVEAGDTVTLICDDASATVAAALLAELDEARARSLVFILERRAVRPLAGLPPEIARALRSSCASIYTVHPKDGEYAHRKELIGMVAPLRLRHAHMIRITEDAMMQGMLSDYRRVAKLNAIVKDRLARAKEIRVTGANGTDLSVTLDPTETIYSMAGVIAPGEWANLPNGEVYTVPLSAEGVFVCDGTVPTEEKYERSELSRHPLRIEIADGRLVKLEGGPGTLANAILATVRSGRNVDRVGMFAVGTNFELLMSIGDASQDMFMPGAYFSLGRPVATGNSDWTSTCQLSFSARKTSLVIDGEALVDGGRYPSRLLDLTRE